MRRFGRLPGLLWMVFYAAEVRVASAPAGAGYVVADWITRA
jgi:hypothetical protein